MCITVVCFSIRVIAERKQRDIVGKCASIQANARQFGGEEGGGDKAGGGLAWFLLAERSIN